MSAPIDKYLQALGETLIMVGVSSVIAIGVGLALAIVLTITGPRGLYARPRFYKGLSVTVNIFRAIPFIILLVAIIPFTRLIVGTSIGTVAAIVPLTVGAIPFVARLIEGALIEVPFGLQEAAQAMGAKPLQIIQKVLLPEALPGIINALTITLVTLVNYSAMAGAIGGGGLGDVGIRYGYQRFDPAIMLVTVVILVLLVQLIQGLGDRLVKRVDHR